ncbi:hypothetical protein B9T29_12170 [Acinetobacter sp. ANC 3903]|nr:hypothetical protein B9T29_12170 [Acinetobacter sp. ANC 3903]
MKRIKLYTLLLFILLCGCLFILISANLTHALEAIEKPQTKKVYDLFSGTISEKQGQLILKHCTLAKYPYPLHFNHPEDEKRIRNLLQQDPNFWLNLRASAYSENKEYHLIVDGIAEIYPQASCHLTDLLSNLDKL